MASIREHAYNVVLIHKIIRPAKTTPATNSFFSDLLFSGPRTVRRTIKKRKTTKRNNDYFFYGYKDVFF